MLTRDIREGKEIPAAGRQVGNLPHVHLQLTRFAASSSLSLQSSTLSNRAREGAMGIFSELAKIVGNDRLLFNIVAVVSVLGVTLVAWLLLRFVSGRGLAHLAQVSGWKWLNGVNRRLRSALFWLAMSIMVLTVLGSVGYHLAGRHVRHDLRHWYAQLTWQELLAVGVAGGELVLLAAVLWLAIRQMRRVLPAAERRIAVWLGNHKEESLRRCFLALERYAAIMLGLAAFWCAGKVVGLSHLAGEIDDVVFRILVTLSLAHVLTLSCKTLTRALSAWGERHLAQTRYHRYWEQLTRLFPLGERCFELAVYVSAASLCLQELTFIAVVASYGSRVVVCIGIFFGTRVIIELSQVLLNDAFGMYEEDRAVNQKGETLVPLLHSVCQYVFYFGSGVTMLGVLGIPTSPILAGAGILGLAGGLGAQSLVTDVVSGFFILFETQYLVGDYIKVGEAGGRVEAVSIRCTHIRDDQGRVHIIPNGQIKAVINYSKDYVVAEVDMVVPSETNLDEIFAAMTEAGRRLKQTRKEVLGDTVIKGLVDLTPSNMTVRAITRVQPGTHALMQSEYRRHLKQVLDEQKAKQMAPVLASFAA
jgi:small-conductance mechanosensitive channel